jgi:spore coat polysaccharide biosynthesis protein SpsF
VIKSHYGFFTEVVSLKALNTVDKLCTENYHREHVTNFIYENSHLFNVNLIPIPFEENDSIRFTIDTLEDFEICKKIFKETGSDDPLELITYAIEKNYNDLMRSQIKLYTK